MADHNKTGAPSRDGRPGNGEQKNRTDRSGGNRTGANGRGAGKDRLNGGARDKAAPRGPASDRGGRENGAAPSWAPRTAGYGEGNGGHAGVKPRFPRGAAGASGRGTNPGHAAGSGTAPARPAADPRPTPGRLAALNALCDIRENGAFAASALDRVFEKANMPHVEKRFCTNLTYACEENRLKTQYVLDRFLTDREALSTRLQIILEMSVSQKLYMDRVPDSAIVDEAVKLTRFSRAEGMTGLVNAVLRKTFENLNGDFSWPDREKDPAGYMSVMCSVPRWLCERLMAEYGDDAEKICAYRGKHAITIRPNRMRFSSSDALRDRVLAKKVWDCEKAPYLDAWYVRDVSDISRDSDYAAGAFSIEGVSSMLAAEAVGVRAGIQVLDACAAPGGKTAYMAERMNGTGRVYAWDVYEHRVELIRAAARRLSLDNIRPVVRDARAFRNDMAGMMDAVLLDAPCTGLGVMDNKPDIKYRVTEAQIAELTQLQAKILDTCAGYVRKGGTLVYSTCSFLKEENEEQIGLFLKNHPEFRMDALPESFGPLRENAGERGLQILPWRDGIDGFFIARMKRD